MKTKYYTPISTIAGGLLAIMIFFNGLLSKYTTPFFSSLVVHTVGLFTSLLLWLRLNKTKNNKLISKKAPLWAYFGGFAGALSVVTANLAVNSKLGLAGSLSFFILGQTITSLFFDYFGLFKSNKRKLNKIDGLKFVTILLGALLVINGGV